MSVRLRPSSRRSRIMLLVLLGLVVAVILTGAALLFAAQALNNPGFERGMEGWVGSGPAGNWAVVSTETPAKYPTYAQMGNATVEPASGEKMLRIGLPQGKDKHQAKAVTKVEQTFTAWDTDRLAVAFRLFSWEHREGRDAFSIDIQDMFGNSVGVLEYPVAVTLPTGKALADGPLPYSLSLDIGADKYLDSDWVVIRIKDIPRFQMLKLTYTLNTDRDAAHDSWVYVDWWNLAPQAEFEYSPLEPVVGDEVSLDARASSDPDVLCQDYIAAWDWTITHLESGSVETLSGERAKWTPSAEGDYTIRLTVMDSFGATDSAEQTLSVIALNEPPVAVIDVLGESWYEGEYVELVSVRSSDPNGEADIVSRHWNITGGGVLEESDEANVYFVPPKEGTYTITLTVSDQGGMEDSASQEIVVANSPPGVGAVNVEVLPGRAPELLGRFIDCGWQDTHSAQWTFAGEAFVATVQEDGLPQLSSGAAAAAGPLVDAGQTLVGSFKVTDSAGGSSEVPAKVIGIADDPMRDEPNDTLVPAGPTDPLISVPAINAGSVHLSYIQSAGDVDFFELLMPNGDALPYGAELLVILKDLPADFDLAVFEKIPEAEFGAMPANRMPANRMPANRMPVNRMPANRMPVNRMPANRMPANRMPVLLAPANRMPVNRMPANRMPANRMPANRMPVNRMDWGWGQPNAPELTAIPFAELSYLASPDYQELGAGDIAFSELGLDALVPAGTDAVAYSASRALGDEAVLVKTQYLGSRMFVAVVGANGTFSSEPYALQVEAALPHDLADLYEFEPGTPLVTDGATSVPSVISEPEPGTPLETLIVTAPERMTAYYGTAAWNTLEAELTSFAERTDVNGMVIALPSTLYDSWDIEPYRVEKANGVAEEIREIVADHLTDDTTYVVLVGNDRIIPQRRIKDQTQISNELFYADSSLLELGSPLAASLFGGYDLTDDFYVDAVPSFWQGSEFYVPDLAIGRLVETPAEIMSVIGAYVDTDGSTYAQSATVTGYDFFIDGADAVAATFAEAGLSTDTSLINSTWLAADLRESLLGASASDLSSINAHFMHYAALSAGGWALDDYGDLLLSGELLAIPDVLWGRFIFSMGCHSGLNVPDGDIVLFESDTDVDPALDFAQAMATQGASFIGPTGYGLGDTAGIGGTERLVGLFSQYVSSEVEMSVGDALVAAKRAYLSGLAQMTSYDVKSCVDWTLYGLPMYKVTTPEQVTPTGGGSGSGSFGSMGIEPSPFYEPVASRISVVDNGATSVFDLALNARQASTGTYYDAGTPFDVLNVEGRPLQPSYEIPLASTGGRVHGLFVTGGTYTELGDFDPAIGTLTTGWLKDVVENTTSVDGYWPAASATYNTFETAGTPAQSLVVLPGQFKRTSVIDEDVTGVQRLYSSLGVEVLRSDSDDLVPPTIKTVNLYVNTAGDLTAAIDMGTTPEPIRAVQILAVYNGIMAGNPWVPATGQEGAPVHIVPVTNLPPGAAVEDVSLIVQVADAAGNVAVNTAKGATLRMVAVDAGEDQMTAPSDVVVLTARVYGWSSLAQPVMYEWDFGDGTSQSGVISEYELEAGSMIARFHVEHVYTSDTAVTATLRVTDAFGGTGTDSVVWAPLPLPASLWFVSMDGDDTSGDGSETNPWKTIQHALDTAEAGATVRVAPGVYHENVRIWKDSQSLEGWTATSTVVFAPGSHALEVEYDTHNVEIRRLTITGGSEYAGAGVFCDRYSSSTFTDCLITGNVCPSPMGDGGAGMWAEDAVVTMRRCTVTGNHSLSKAGGIGVRSVPAPGQLTLIDCYVGGNTAGTQGGGVWCQGQALVIRGSTLSGNTATSDDGGAVYMLGLGSSPPLDISSCTITRNTARYGGGVWGQGVKPTVSRSLFRDNTASIGGGLYLWYSTEARVMNNVFWKNTADYWGAGVHTDSASGLGAFINNTVVGNTTMSAGTGGLHDNDGSMRIFNCVFDGNTTNGSPDDLGGLATTAYSYVGSASGTPVNGNIHGSQIPVIPPDFVDAAAGDFHLRHTSVLIDAGIHTWTGVAAPTVDFDGRPRPNGIGVSGLWDMGAYEVPLN